MKACAAIFKKGAKRYADDAVFKTGERTIGKQKKSLHTGKLFKKGRIF